MTRGLCGGLLLLLAGPAVAAQMTSLDAAVLVCRQQIQETWNESFDAYVKADGGVSLWGQARDVWYFDRCLDRHGQGDLGPATPTAVREP